MEKTQKGRSFVFTINVFDENTEEKLQDLSCTYLIYGYEISPTTNRPHLQGYVYFPNPRTTTGVIKDLNKLCTEPYVRPAKGAPEQNFDYCSKDGYYYERGLRPKSEKEKGVTEKLRWETARTSAIKGDFSSIPADIYIRYQASLKRIRREDGDPPVNLDCAAAGGTYGLWIWGPPRVGKSHLARTKYTPLYLKDTNKWWDGYDGEPYVLIDELCPEQCKYMVHFLKRWADRWVFSAETKGARIQARPQLIIVTSNYSPDDCFTGVDLDAIRSRFKVMHMTTPFTNLKKLKEETVDLT